MRFCARGTAGRFRAQAEACGYELAATNCFWLAWDMAKASLAAMVSHCDRTLRTAKVQDYDGAVNGLQVENGGAVSRIAATVDASLATVKLAVAAQADLLIVHHGLFWGATHPWTGKRHELLRLLLNHNLAVYSSHLPLDAHPKLGNNARLCAALGFRKLRPFFLTRDSSSGFRRPPTFAARSLERGCTRCWDQRPSDCREGRRCAGASA